MSNCVGPDRTHYENHEYFECEGEKYCKNCGKKEVKECENS